MTTATTTTIEELEAQGYTVRINHYRSVSSPSSQPMTKFEYNSKFRDAAWNKVLLPHGGRTEVDITKKVGMVVLGVTGIAICNNEDNFCKKIGISLALSRAVRALGWKMSDYQD